MDDELSAHRTRTNRRYATGGYINGPINLHPEQLPCALPPMSDSLIAAVDAVFEQPIEDRD
jgi:hypothetical protein